MLSSFLISPFLPLSHILFNSKLMAHHWKYVCTIPSSFVLFFFCCIHLTKPELRITLQVHMFGSAQDWNTLISAFRKSWSTTSNASPLLSNYSCFPSLPSFPTFSEAISSILPHSQASCTILRSFTSFLE